MFAFIKMRLLLVREPLPITARLLLTFKIPKLFREAFEILNISLPPQVMVPLFSICRLFASTKLTFICPSPVIFKTAVGASNPLITVLAALSVPFTWINGRESLISYWIVAKLVVSVPPNCMVRSSMFKVLKLTSTLCPVSMEICPLD